MASAPIVLVPGFWLGAWAWDEVAERLREAGHEVTALTLPGLESADADRTEVTFADHVDAIVAAIEAAARPVVLAVHSGAGAPGHEALDRVPTGVAHMVYVDTGAATGPMNPDFDGVEWPLPSAEELAETENLDGLSDEQLATFRDRAVPQPGALLREGPTLHNVARLDVPTTVICTAFPAEQYREAVAQGMPFLAGLADVRDLDYVDLPTSHWPMWSRPQELTQLLADIAERSAG